MTIQNGNKKKNTKESSIDYIIKHGAISETLAATIQVEFARGLGDLTLSAAMTSLLAERKKINQGNLESAENMLMMQAHTLNIMFNSLANQAIANSEFVPHFEMFMRLAFKAQSQSRATLETLGKIKNPPQVAFVKQANIGHNQQVNNGALKSTSRTEEIKNQQTQLLEEQHGERLDIRTQGQTINANKELEAVGKVYRAENF
jgi:hypothetical protein